MKRSYFIGLLLISACSLTNTKPGQKGAEDLAKHYLDSALNGQGNYQIISYGKLDTVLSSDVQKKSQIKEWAIYATYQGNNALGIYERHKVLLHIDSSFSRVTSVTDAAKAKK